MKREDVEKFVDSIEVDRTILHPEGLEMPCDGPNFGSMKPTVRSESNLQRSASPTAPWNEEELDKRSTCEVTTGNVDGRGEDMKTQRTKKESQAFVKSIPVHTEVLHPEGVDVPEDEANFGWVNQAMAKQKARLERSASPAAPWSEEELDERSTLGPDDAPAAADAATTNPRKINTAQTE